MPSIQKPTVQHPSIARNEIGLTVRDYEGAISTLCAGCGHDSISAAIVQACYEMSLPAHRIAKLSGGVAQINVGIEPEGMGVSPDGAIVVTTSETTNMAPAVVPSSAILTICFFILRSATVFSDYLIAIKRLEILRDLR